MIPSTKMFCSISRLPMPYLSFYKRKMFSSTTTVSSRAWEEFTLGYPLEGGNRFETINEKNENEATAMTRQETQYWMCRECARWTETRTKAHLRRISWLYYTHEGRGEN